MLDAWYYNHPTTLADTMSLLCHLHEFVKPSKWTSLVESDKQSHTLGLRVTFDISTSHAPIYILFALGLISYWSFKTHIYH